MKQRKYLYLQDDDDEYWIELDEENYAIRQIIREPNDILHLSCFEDCLAEGPIIDLSEFNIISYDTFQQIWNKCISTHDSEWDNIKNKYVLGSSVNLRVECFYPQGIIMKGSNFIAIYMGNRNFKLHEIVNLQVVQYDDENHWVIVR